MKTENYRTRISKGQICWLDGFVFLVSSWLRVTSLFCIRRTTFHLHQSPQEPCSCTVIPNWKCLWWCRRIIPSLSFKKTLVRLSSGKDFSFVSSRNSPVHNKLDTVFCLHCSKLRSNNISEPKLNCLIILGNCWFNPMRNPITRLWVRKPISIPPGVVEVRTFFVKAQQALSRTVLKNEMKTTKTMRHSQSRWR